MGLGPFITKLNLKLWQQGYFKNFKSVVDVGSQELHLKSSELEQMFKSAGIDYKKEKFANLANFPGHPRCSTKPFYEALGFQKYTALDCNGEHGSIKIDLNYPLEDKSLYNQFDLVTDYGCNEHAFNVGEAYRTLHRLCKPGGIIIIFQALLGGNGYYLFDLSFFEGLAAANNYKVLFNSYVLCFPKGAPQGEDKQVPVPVSREILETLQLFNLSGIGVCYVLQKQSDADFKYPYQGQLMADMQGHDGFDLLFSPEPPGYSYVPSTESVMANTRTTTLIKVVVDRITKRIKKIFKK